MTRHRSCSVILALAIAVLASAGRAAEPAAPPAPAPADAEELGKLVAPIALYPDALVAHILPASTYPIQVVVAQRAIEGGKRPTDAELEQWDPSIQALTAFPTVLKMMNDRLEWTTELGQAVSANHDAVLAAIQAQREKAKNVGNLESNDKQVVKVESNTIVIEPANPQVIYVPQYDPVAIYAYAPVWYAPAAYGMMAFSAGFAAGALTAYAFDWGHGPAWHGGDIHVNNDFHFDRDTNIDIDRNIDNSVHNKNTVNKANFSKWQPQNKSDVGRATGNRLGGGGSGQHYEGGGSRPGGGGSGGTRPGSGGSGERFGDHDYGGGHARGGSGGDMFNGAGGSGWSDRGASSRGSHSFGGGGYGGGGYGGAGAFHGGGGGFHGGGGGRGRR